MIFKRTELTDFEKKTFPVSANTETENFSNLVDTAVAFLSYRCSEPSESPKPLITPIPGRFPALPPRSYPFSRSQLINIPETASNLSLSQSQQRCSSPRIQWIKYLVLAINPAGFHLFQRVPKRVIKASAYLRLSSPWWYLNEYSSRCTQAVRFVWRNESRRDYRCYGDLLERETCRGEGSTLKPSASPLFDASASYTNVLITGRRHLISLITDFLRLEYQIWNY